MFNGWSPHQGGTENGQPIKYFFEAEVAKRVGATKKVVQRNPAPELLVGHPELFMAALQLLPFQNRYRAATLSFSSADINPDTFNLGDPGARAAVASCTEAFIELSYAGVPPQNRLPFVVGTHTHAGNLEVNFALPRAVFDSAGKVRSFNPHPPTKGSLNDFDHFNDMLNHHFDWQDPRNPLQRRRLKTANWIEKSAAEFIRNGSFPDPDRDPTIHLWLTLSSLSFEMVVREDLMSSLEKELPELGLCIQKTTRNSISIGHRNGDSARMCLHGSLIDGVSQISPDEIDQRYEYIQGARGRVALSWQKRAAWNSKRYSADEWSEPMPDFAALLAAPKLSIPKAHPKHSVMLNGLPVNGSGVVRVMLERISTLRSEFIDVLSFARIAPKIFEILNNSIRKLSKMLEQINDTDTARRLTERHQSGSDRRYGPSIDHVAAANARRERQGANVRAISGNDLGAQCGAQGDGQADEIFGCHHSPKPQIGSDRKNAEFHRRLFGRTSARDKINIWHAARRAVRKLNQDDDVRCYLVVPEDPSAVSIRSHQWRITVANQQIQVTHGDIDQQLLDDLTAEIREELSVKGLSVNLGNDRDQVEDFTPTDNVPCVGL